MRKWGTLLGCGLLSACAGAPPEQPAAVPAPSTRVVAPSATVVPATPPGPPEIGSGFEVDPADPLPRGAVARCGTTRMRASFTYAFAVSNTGSILAVDSPGRRWILRDVTLGVDVGPLPGGRHAAFSPDASVVVVESEQEPGRLAFFSTAKGLHLGDVKIPLPPRPNGTSKVFSTPTRIDELHRSDDGRGLVVTTSAGDIHLVDMGQRTLVGSAKIPANGRLVGISRNGERVVFELAEPKPPSKRGGDFPGAEFGGVMGGSFDLSNIGSRVGIAGVTVLDLRARKPVHKETFQLLPPNPDNPRAPRRRKYGRASFRLSLDGTTLYRREGEDLIAIDLVSKKESLQSSPGPGSKLWLEVGNASWESSSADGSWSVKKRGARFELSHDGPALRDGHQGPVSSLAFLSSTQLVTVVSRLDGGGPATFWSTTQCSRLDAPAVPAESVVSAPQAALAFLGGTAAAVVTEGHEVKPLAGDNRFHAAALSPDGETLYLGGKLYQNESLLRTEEIGRLAGAGRRERSFPDRIGSVAVAPDGLTLALAVGDRFRDSPPSLHLVAASDLSGSTQVTVGNAGTVAFAGPSRLLFASEDAGLSLRAVPTLDELGALHHLSCCKVMAVSPDGRIAAGAHGRGFTIWDVQSRGLVAQIDEAHRDEILALAFSPDGRHLATGSKDTTVLLWNVNAIGVPALVDKAETTITGAAAAKRFFELPPSPFEIKADGTLEARVSGESHKAPALEAVTLVTSSGDAHCAIARGKVRCWGSTGAGVLGIPEHHTDVDRYSFMIDNLDSASPATVAVKDPVDLRLFAAHACALERSGNLLCWGFLAADKAPAPPRKVLGNVKSFASGGATACAVGTDRVARCWDRAGAIPTPLPVADVVMVAAGIEHVCVLGERGEVRCKGKNQHDELGDATGLDRSDPVTVKDVRDAVAIVASEHGTCALTKSASVLCWGALGKTHFATPTRLFSLDGATALRIDADAVCGLRGDKVDCVKMGGDPD